MKTWAFGPLIAASVLLSSLLLASCGGQSICDSTNCAGCCDPVGKCLSGNVNNGCGSRCRDCTTCSTGNSCTQGQCLSINPGGNNPDGGGGGPGRDAGVTGVAPSCSAGEDCPTWFCDCSSGPPVNSRRCVNKRCATATESCTNSCASFSTTWECTASGGWPGGFGNGCTIPPPQDKPKVYGCSLSKYSSQFSVTTVYFGSSSISETSARNNAQAQCLAANFLSSFCTSGSMYCAAETNKPTQCTWSNYSSSTSATVYFYGEGNSSVAAKEDAVQKCLDSGAWKGWFCGSGSLACAAN